MDTLPHMQPIRANHRISRTKEGETAWRTQALAPQVRSLLGSLKNTQTVAALLQSGGWSPNDLEGALNKLARSGWVLIQDQSFPQDGEPDLDGQEVGTEVDEGDLEALLSRHRSEKEQTQVETALSEIDLPSPRSTENISASPSPSKQLAPPSAPAFTTTMVNEVENVAELPFDSSRAQDDGLLNALRNPETSVLNYEQAPEWAPPSGGLAALLRALGESVPDGVDLSPDQQEHLKDLVPLEPWGGVSSMPAHEEEKPEKTPFARLRDQPGEEGRPKARLGALHESLSKVQQEQALTNAARDRAKQVRSDREAQLKKVHAEQALRRQQEERNREGSTLIGLSQKLARVKSNRENNE